MSNESSDAVKIHRAPNGKFYVWANGEAICLPNGSLRYFETQRDARVLLTDCDRVQINKDRRIAEFSRNRTETAIGGVSGCSLTLPPPMSTMQSIKRAMTQAEEGSTP